METRKFQFVGFALLHAFGFSLSARAAFVFNISQTPTGTVAFGGGVINTTALRYLNRGTSSRASMDPDQAYLSGGPSSGGELSDGYSGVLQVPQFGYGQYQVYATSGTGDVVGILGGNIEVPAGYVSGNYLSCTDTWAFESFAYIGLTPGSYVYTWGSGATADSLTINVGTVPEPACFGAMALAATLSLRRRPRRTQHDPQ